MWRRTYLLLLLIRIYFTLSPSYIHPDEHFQGPEVFAGRIYSYPSLLTWEFTSDHPIRSIFPIWLLYGLPMTLLKWLWAEVGNGNPPPRLIYCVLRFTMFLLSLILEDWAIHELVTNPRRRRQAVVLVASSYVTWTYQTHTFSNSLETLLVTWSLVLIQWIVENKQRSSIFLCGLLSFVIVLGSFNRITFPAFILIPALHLVPHFLQKPFSFVSVLLFGIIFSFFAVSIDTFFYNPSATYSDLLYKPIITPLNNVLYNSDSANLALHGIHPRYQHFLINLPQLLGPAFILLVWSLVVKRGSASIFPLRNVRAYAAFFGTAVLSIFPHQEARFLMPCIPLLLTSFRPPRSRIFLASWVIFNGLLGILMGVYHQGGVVPTQLHMPTLLSDAIPTAKVPDITKSATVLWWKAYSPPLWLFGDARMNFTVNTRDLKGMPRAEFQHELDQSVLQCTPEKTPVDYTDMNSPKIKLLGNLTFLVAPHSNPFLDQFVAQDSQSTTNLSSIRLHKLWEYKQHVNMDDFDPGDDGLWGAIQQVFGRRGLFVWLVTRQC